MSGLFFAGREARERLLPVLVVGLAVIAGMLGLYIMQPRLVQLFDLKIYDLLLPLRKHENPSPVPVIVDIDESSIARYGQWPWPRYLMAELLDDLEAAGVAAVGFDIMFTEEDRSSPRMLHHYLQRDMGVELPLSGLPGELWDYDVLMGRSLADKPAVLGFYARFDGEAVERKLPPSVGIVARNKPGAAPFDLHLMQASDVSLPLPVLYEQTPVGFINVAPGLDGIIRRVPLLIKAGDTIYPSLAVRTLMRGLGVETLALASGPEGLETITVGGNTIPVTPEGFILVPFQGGAGTYRYVSAGDVLAGTADRELLRNRVVFVGTSAPGLMDLRTTPFARVLPGVEVHAAVLDAILTQNSILPPPWTPGVQVSAIFLFGVAAAAVFGLARPRVYIPMALLLVGLAVFIAVQAFARGMFLSPLYVVLTVSVQGFALLFLRFIHEERQKLVLRHAFSHYVSPEVVDRITRLRGNFFAGEERELSVLFTDIRGFTSISERLDPQQVVSLLNRYFTPMTALVREHKGTLDKFMGDALMAFWNAPLDVPGHAEHAVATALAMQQTLGPLNKKIQDEFGVNIQIGAGIHTGTAYVGNMGSDDLTNYTLIGDTVNLASRLEGLCAQYGVNIVVSESTMRQCGEAFAFQHVDTLRVKGKQQPVDVYLPMPWEQYEERLEELREWTAARESYKAGLFAKAAKAFAGLRKRFPGVGLYAVYEERALNMAAAPPTGWDGVWNVAQK